jgi:hypothetical protein
MKLAPATTSLMSMCDYAACLAVPLDTKPLFSRSLKETHHDLKGQEWEAVVEGEWENG